MCVAWAEHASCPGHRRSAFRRKANALSGLSHPTPPPSSIFDTADGADFLVMGLVRGPSLRGEPEDEVAPSREKDVLCLGAQLARGLQAAHEQGILVVAADASESRLIARPEPRTATTGNPLAARRLPSRALVKASRAVRAVGEGDATRVSAEGSERVEFVTGRTP